MVIPLAKPHAPIVCNSMWALTDFTEQDHKVALFSSPVFGRRLEHGVGLADPF